MEEDISESMDWKALSNIQRRERNHVCSLYTYDINLPIVVDSPYAILKDSVSDDDRDSGLHAYTKTCCSNHNLHAGILHIQHGRHLLRIPDRNQRFRCCRRSILHNGHNPGCRLHHRHGRRNSCLQGSGSQG